ncbi:hypothetical protein NQ652_18360, partial [Acinetobacter baumannii]|nr:hypothetical protein [Acinetobacter baumannii]
DYFNNIRLLVKLGITRILTSGHEKNVEIGIENIKKAVEENLPIIAGCGININNLHKFKELGIKEVHGSFSKKIVNDYSIDFGNYSVLDQNVEKNVDFISF